jgi:Ca2+-transporting ATPase
MRACSGFSTRSRRPALKQADTGVAMGSSSEISRQAAKIVLTDDNFATLVRAVDLGRDIYRRISTYVRMQLTILSSVLQLMVYATILNINVVALFPLQLLFAKFFVVITVVIGFIADVPDPRGDAAAATQARHKDRQHPPDHPLGRHRVRGRRRRPVYARLRARQASTTHASASLTMAFAIVSLSAVNIGLIMRRKRQAP